MRYLSSAVERRKLRVRNKVRAQALDSGRLRLTVFRSNKYIHAQLIHDGQHHTVASASSIEKGARESLGSTSNVEAARYVGKAIAKRALDAGVDAVVFDRGAYLYHGRIKALAEAAREAGLKF